MISTFLKGAIGLNFCFLLLVRLKGLVMGVTLRFDGKNSDCFCALKVLIDSLVLFLGKNVSIHETKSACPIFISGL